MYVHILEKLLENS